MKLGKMGKDRWQEKGTRRGSQMQPAVFMRHMVDSPRQGEYAPIFPREFNPPLESEKRCARK